MTILFTVLFGSGILFCLALFAYIVFSAQSARKRLAVAVANPGTVQRAWVECRDEDVYSVKVDFGAGPCTVAYHDQVRDATRSLIAVGVAVDRIPGWCLDPSPATPDPAMDYPEDGPFGFFLNCILSPGLILSLLVTLVWQGAKTLFQH